MEEAPVRSGRQGSASRSPGTAGPSAGYGVSPSVYQAPATDAPGAPVRMLKHSPIAAGGTTRAHDGRSAGAASNGAVDEGVVDGRAKGGAGLRLDGDGRGTGAGDEKPLGHSMPIPRDGSALEVCMCMFALGGVGVVCVVCVRGCCFVFHWDAMKWWVAFRVLRFGCFGFAGEVAGISLAGFGFAACDACCSLCVYFVRVFRVFCVLRLDCWSPEM